MPETTLFDISKPPIPPKHTRVFRCLFCNARFGTQAARRQHRWKYHDKAKSQPPLKSWLNAAKAIQKQFSTRSGQFVYPILRNNSSTVTPNCSQIGRRDSKVKFNSPRSISPKWLRCKPHCRANCS